VPQALRVLTHVAHAADHVLKMVVRLAEVVERSRQPDAPSQPVPVSLRIEPERPKLFVAGRVEHARRRLEDIREVPRKPQGRVIGLVMPFALGP
jgi:hypothetical protein